MHLFYATEYARSLDDRLPNGVNLIAYHNASQGKGAALRTGFKCATSDFVVVQDADLGYDPQGYPEVLEPLLVGKADVVIGSR